MATTALSAAHAIPEGTIRITGTIWSLYWRQRKGFGPFGSGSKRPHTVMLVLMDGPDDFPSLRVKGTVPRNIERELIPLLYEHRAEVVNCSELVRTVTVRVAFTATVTRSDQDPTFGFFKHPTNAVVVADQLQRRRA